MKKLDLSPQLKTSAIVCFLIALGCVNRGQHAPPSGGSGGAAGTGGHGGGGVDAKDSGDGGVGGGDSCETDAGFTDGGIADAGGTEAGAADAGSCGALFNFESPAGCGLYGASLGRSIDNPSATDGFTRLYHTGIAACGRGGMAVDVDFNGSTRTGGEIVIPIATSGVSYAGKTFTISMMGSSAAGPNKFYVFLIAGRYEPVLSMPIAATWSTMSVALPAPDASADNVMSLSLQMHGPSSYLGTIYVDEIDVRNSPPDGGPSDAGVSDGGTSDVRDAGGDVRDAAAGN